VRSRRRAIAVAGVLSGVVVVVVVVVIVLVATGSRSSSEYAQFSRCPLSDPATSLCLVTETVGGRLTVGTVTVPIEQSLRLQGGVHVIQNREREVVRDVLIAARGGATLSRTPQAMPGGLAGTVDAALLPAGLRRQFDGLIAGGNANVAVTIELARPASSLGIDIQNLIEAAGIALVLPARVRLSNRFLGADCYIGSTDHPISLRLTTGETHPPQPNTPIRGRVGKATFSDEYNLTVIRGSSLVDNSFAVPAATGCGTTPSRSVDRAVNARLGLPAAGGHNTVILDGTLRDANAPAVRTAGADS
jgi:hypothetical protein